jgi:hypothetical protein
MDDVPLSHALIYATFLGTCVWLIAALISLHLSRSTGALFADDDDDYNYTSKKSKRRRSGGTQFRKKEKDASSPASTAALVFVYVALAYLLIFSIATLFVIARSDTLSTSINAVSRSSGAREEDTGSAVSTFVAASRVSMAVPETPIVFVTAVSSASLPSLLTQFQSLHRLLPASAHLIVYDRGVSPAERMRLEYAAPCSIDWRSAQQASSFSSSFSLPSVLASVVRSVVSPVSASGLDTTTHLNPDGVSDTTASYAERPVIVWADPSVVFTDPLDGLTDVAVHEGVYTPPSYGTLKQWVPSGALRTLRVPRYLERAGMRSTTLVAVHPASLPVIRFVDDWAAAVHAPELVSDPPHRRHDEAILSAIYALYTHKRLIPQSHPFADRRAGFVVAPSASM